MFQALGMSGFAFLLWVRIDWGFQEWIHETAFYNFWNGAYVLMSGKSDIRKIMDMLIKPKRDITLSPQVQALIR